MTLVSAVSLFVVCVLCIAGLASDKYRENWLQWFGLWGLMFWSLARGIDMLDRDHIGAQQFISHISLALFAVGTALQTRKT